MVYFVQMVLAERQLTISGGNFHGEYPAKVSCVFIQVIVRARVNFDACD